MAKDQARPPKNGKWIKTLKDYQTWQLLLIWVVLTFVVVNLLRINNTGMISRREAVKLSDQEGESELIKNRLADLSQYVASHMNASTGRFFLEGQYKRDSEMLIARAEEQANHNPNGNIYKKASEVCDPKFTYRNAAYFQCYMNELAKYPAANYGATEVQLPNPNLYQLELNSPSWTPDFAGFGVLAWLAVAMVIFVRVIVRLILLAMLQKHKKRI